MTCTVKAPGVWLGYCECASLITRGRRPGTRPCSGEEPVPNMSRSCLSQAKLINSNHVPKNEIPLRCYLRWGCQWQNDGRRAELIRFEGFHAANRDCPHPNDVLGLSGTVKVKSQFSPKKAGGSPSRAESPGGAQGKDRRRTRPAEGPPRKLVTEEKGIHRSQAWFCSLLPGPGKTARRMALARDPKPWKLLIGGNAIDRSIHDCGREPCGRGAGGGIHGGSGLLGDGF